MLPKKIEKVQESVSKKKKKEEFVVVEKKMLEDIYAQNEKIQRRLLWMSIGNLIRFVFVYLPIIIAILLSIFYLPGYVDTYIQEFGNSSADGISSSFFQQLEGLLK
ncbi:hypothetical protein KKG22_01930 [Patescibacteria group bacterium]|nr:hypothetical protein [Patescibacteria group bacterium]MBU1721886.1 hypothetical protein [Patescibacteria group bacterium]MBU1900882.1 hypothetical protein [Patescibacteria group bacterium]